MGEVYRARDTRLDRTVAIKVLPSQLAADPQLRERFEREARAISVAQSSAHLRAVRRRHEPSARHAAIFLVLEYLEGETLAERLAAGRLVRRPRRCSIAMQICDALDRRTARASSTAI